MVVHKVPLKHDDPQLQIISQQPTGTVQRTSKTVPLVRQAPVFDLEVITSDNFVPWKNTFNMRQVTLANIIDVANGNDKASTKAAKMRAKNFVNAAKSLDLLRQNLQSSINKEIDNVIRKYLTTYFGVAIDNVKNNLGSNCMTEDHVREVCRTMLDEAKLMYSNPPLSGSNSPFNTSQTTDMLIESRFAKQHSKNRSPLKRKEPIPELDDNLSPVIDQQSSQTSLTKHQRFQSAWDPSKIHSQTLFVLATRANKRGSRLCNKHPELFQYTIDQEDREWLMKQKLFVLPPPSPSNSTSILLLEDVQLLLSSVNYKNNPHELKGFELPEFILNKVRSTMIIHKPDEIRSPQQIIITENGEIEEQTACSITLNENNNSSITQSAAHSESSSIMISGTSTTLAEALNMLEYGERLPQQNDIAHLSPNNNTGLATTHSTLTALLAAENSFMSASSNNSGNQSNNNVNTQFGM
ncbi:deoxynucleotidyltransferase terminal-interacting protein 1 isoform X2 [Daktulosphaira vitifoliae]|nr:deoxynucleotidyltransferase terminal-interacting protein 1 isoform X2 [Daktulosphaira vitifoliae]XP_050532623.1 deoxynucleotidyltransferase terminal-interacting protein 1 isoform X2 [Daktulosphaira vitifoliae]XP_050532624.1 deoxynucleotidyltransferase terminal-interacting protein 1 isoform X2 [Daktulosphaira vitifoliae]